MEYTNTYAAVMMDSRASARASRKDLVFLVTRFNFESNTHNSQLDWRDAAKKEPAVETAAWCLLSGTTVGVC